MARFHPLLLATFAALIPIPWEEAGSSAWLNTCRSRLANASRSRELLLPLRIPSTATNKRNHCGYSAIC